MTDRYGVWELLGTHESEITLTWNAQFERPTDAINSKQAAVYELYDTNLQS
jgi:hypothetical protein